jgi:hypothetical protein
MDTIKLLLVAYSAFGDAFFGPETDLDSGMITYKTILLYKST